MSDLPMEFIKALPPQAVAVFAFAFALALLVAKLFDIIEKWQKIRGPKSEKEIVSKSSYMESSKLSTRTIMGYSFSGAIFLPLVHFISYAVFIRVPGVIEGQFFSLISYGIYSFFAAMIVTFYIRKKFDLLNYNKVVTLLTGFAVASVISMPINMLSFIIQINKLAR